MKKVVEIAQEAVDLAARYKVTANCLPLDMISNLRDAHVYEWYRVPSWRVELYDEAWAGVDVRLHRGLGMEAVWTLSEATTGMQIARNWSSDADDCDALIIEFLEGRGKTLTKAKVTAAIEAGRETLKSKPPCPFAKATA